MMDRMKEHDKRRIAKMKEILEERKIQLADHESGHRRLKDDEYERYTRQVKAFQTKLDRMKERGEEVRPVVVISNLDDSMNMNSQNQKRTETNRLGKLISTMLYTEFILILLFLITLI